MARASQDPSSLDITVLRRWSWSVYDVMCAECELVNGLNYFPVADHDTGYTQADFWAEFASGLLVVRQSAGLGEAVAKAASDVLVPGNSSTILGAWLLGLGAGLRDNAGPAALAQALESAARMAVASVPDPVAGTMLTVYEAAAQAARHASAPSTSISALVRYLERPIAAALEACAVPVERLRTSGPPQDAGAYAMRIMFHMLAETLDPRPAAEFQLPPLPVPRLRPVACGQRLDPRHPRFEVQMRAIFPDALRATVAAELNRVGVDLAITRIAPSDDGNEPTWNIHVHTERPDDALSAIGKHGHILEHEINTLIDNYIDGSASVDRQEPVRHLVIVSEDRPAPQLSTLLDTSEVVLVSTSDAGRLAAIRMARVLRDQARRGKNRHHRAVTVVPARGKEQAVYALSSHDPAVPLGEASLRIYEAAQQA